MLPKLIHFWHDLWTLRGLLLFLTLKNVCLTSFSVDCHNIIVQHQLVTNTPQETVAFLNCWLEKAKPICVL